MCYPVIVNRQIEWKGLYPTEVAFNSEIALGSEGSPESSLEKFAVIELLSYELRFQRLNCLKHSGIIHVVRWGAGWPQHKESKQEKDGKKN